MAARKDAHASLESAHDDLLQKVQTAATQCGLTFAVRDRTTPLLTAVALQAPSMKTPPLFGVVTPYGFSLNLADVTRMTGPEKNKLRDLREVMQRV